VRFRKLGQAFTETLTIAGVSFALVVALFHLPLVGPLFRTMEGTSYDLRLQAESRVRPIPQMTDLVLLGIDDESLSMFGRWPWPRQIWAEVVATLTDLGVRAIFLDVSFPEPSEGVAQMHMGGLTFEETFTNEIAGVKATLSVENMTRLFLWTLEKLSGAPSSSQPSIPAATSAARRAPVATERLVDIAKIVSAEIGASTTKKLDVTEGSLLAFMASPDIRVGESLALARRAGVVTGGLATVVDIVDLLSIDLARARIASRRWVLEHADLPVSRLPEELARRLMRGLRATASSDSPMRDEQEQLRMYRDLYRVLEKNPNPLFSAKELGPELQEFARMNLGAVRYQVVQDASERALAAVGSSTGPVDPEAIWQSAAMRPFRAIERLARITADRTSSRQLLPPLEVPGSEDLLLPWGASVTPGVWAISRQLDSMGTSNEIRDPDGLMRMMPLLWRAGDRLVPSAGLALYLALRRAESGRGSPVALRVETGPTLVISGGGAAGAGGAAGDGAREVRVPIDGRGRCFLHWAGGWDDAFAKLSLVPILSFAGIKRERELYFLNSRDRFYSQVLLFRDLARRLWLDDPMRQCSLQDLGRLIVAKRADYHPEFEWFLTENAPGKPSSLAERRRVGDWYEFFCVLQLHQEQTIFKNIATNLKYVDLQRDPEKRARMQKKLEVSVSAYRRFAEELGTLRRQLRNQLKGKICIIGHIASESTDLAPTPFTKLYPKVGSWANLLNMFEQERFISRPPPLSWSLSGWIHADRLQLPVLLLVCLTMAVALPRLRSAPGFAYALTAIVLWTVFAAVLLIHRGLWIDMVGPVLAMVFAYMAVFTLRNMRTERIRKMFETYVDPQIVSVLVEDPSLWRELGGREQNISAFFSDIAGFTTHSEMLTPQLLSEMLTDYLSPMTEIILANGGTRDKYIGDAIVAFFGAPVASPEHPLSACLSAIDQQRALGELKRKWTQDQVAWYARLRAAGHDLTFRVGLNTGPAKVGNFGSQRSRNYTMIGDSVNLASRLEGANKEYGTLIMASEATVGPFRGRIVTRPLDRLVVKGKVESVLVYEVIGRAGEVAGLWNDLLPLYEQAVALYYQREFHKARDLFRKAAALRADDGPCARYVERCDHYIAAPPGADWDGTFTLAHK
jgi:adenylate cyclase